MKFKEKIKKMKLNIHVYIKFVFSILINKFVKQLNMFRYKTDL